MTDLCAAFEGAGCTNVHSYIQSGNLFFEAGSDLLPVVRETVASLTGVHDNLFVRTADDLHAIISGHPFGVLTGVRALKLYIVFLASAPPIPDLPVVDEKERLELIAVHDSEAYVVSRRKDSGMYGFPNAFVEKHLGLPATSRNWSTVAKLAALANQTPA
jgi:uncharacterized protein (DUF1697 family)